MRKNRGPEGSTITSHYASRNHGPTEVRSYNSHTRRIRTVHTKASQRASHRTTALQGNPQADRKGLTLNKREKEQNGQTTGIMRSKTMDKSQRRPTTVTRDGATPSTLSQVRKIPQRLALQNHAVHTTIATSQ